MLFFIEKSLYKNTKNYSPFKKLTPVSKLWSALFFICSYLVIDNEDTEMDVVVKWLMISLSSSLKFIAGPLLGRLYDLPWWETAFFTFFGMMISIVLFSTVARAFFYKYVKGIFFRNEKKISPAKRRIVKVWNKFGLSGVAFLTPIILTPIGGAIVATSFGLKPVRIIAYMAVSSAFWALVLTLGLYFIPMPF